MDFRDVFFRFFSLKKGDTSIILFLIIQIIELKMLREEPYEFYGIFGTVNPTTRRIEEAQAAMKTIPSKKAVKHTKNYPPQSQRIFVDDEFRCVPSDLDGVGGNEKLVWCRLGELVNARGSLFASNYFSNFAQMQGNPSFLNEVGLLPPFYYQSLFLTPDFTPNGQYRLILNIQGQYKVVVVDDMIPVSQDSMQPIWRLDKEVPWELIVLKAWAKVCGGFKNVLAARPFEFLRTFSYPNWRMKNLDKYDIESAWRFIGTKLQGDQSPFKAPRISQSDPMADEQGLSHTKSQYVLRPGQRQFTIIAKTKNSQRVAECGLMPNAAAYQIVKLFFVKGKYAVKLASSIRNRWNGQFSVLDQNVNQVYDQNLHDITLSKSFIMPFQDFKKLFGLMILSPTNYKNLMTTKHTGYVVDVPSGHKKAQYFRFILKEEGRLDFSVVQGLENLIPNVQRPIGQQNMMLNRSSSMNRIGGPQMSPRPISPNMINGTPFPPASMVGPRPMSQVKNTGSRVVQTTTISQIPAKIPTPMSPVKIITETSALNQQSIDPWFNRNPWSGSPTVMGGAQEQMVMTVTRPGSNSRTVVNSGMGGGMLGTTFPPMGPNIPAQNIPTNSYRPVSSTSQTIVSGLPVSIDPWQNRNPWSGPATASGSIIPTGMGIGQMQSAPGSPVMLPPSQPMGQTTIYGPGSGMGPGVVQQTTTVSGGLMMSMPMSPVGDPWTNRNPWSNPPTVGMSPPGSSSLLPPAPGATSTTVVTSTVPAYMQSSTLPPPPQGVVPLALAATGGASQLQTVPASIPMGHSSFSRTSSPMRVIESAKVGAPFNPMVQLDPWQNVNPWSNPPTVATTSVIGQPMPPAYGTTTFMTQQQSSAPPNFGTGSRVMVETTETTRVVPPPAAPPLNTAPNMYIASPAPIIQSTLPPVATTIPQPPATAIQTVTTKTMGPSYGSAANDPMLMPMNRPVIAGNGVVLANSSYQSYGQAYGHVGTPVNSLVDAAVIDPWMNLNPWSGPPTVQAYGPGAYQQVQYTQYTTPRGIRGGGGPQGDPWLNNNPWGSPVPPGGYFQGMQGMAVGGAPIQMGSVGRPSGATVEQSTLYQALPKTSMIGPGSVPMQQSNPGNVPFQKTVSSMAPMDQTAAMLASKAMNLPSNLPPSSINNAPNTPPTNRQIDQSVAMLASNTMNRTMSQHNLSSGNPNSSAIQPPLLQPLQPPPSSAYRRPPMNSQSINTVISQFPQQQVSALGVQSYVPNNNQMRFLKMKIVLVRVRPNRNNVASRLQRGSYMTDPMSEPEDGYDYVDVDETHGYTAGEAYFQKLPPGEYILHIKPEACAKQISYAINFISEMPIGVLPIKLEPRDKSLLLRSAYLDFARATGPVTFLDQSKSEWISYGPIFNECGYGYIAFCGEVNSPTRLYCEFHPMKLRSEGYICKDIYKNKQTEIGLFSQKGLGRCILFKRIRPDAAWPPQTITFYKAR